MEVGRLHCGGREGKTYCWDSRWALSNGHHCPLAVNLAPRFVVPAIFGYNMRVQQTLSVYGSPKLGEYHIRYDC